jgi:hypothetical protein
MRAPYLIQIGFDFGTSFCKCVCRDVYQNRAWVHCEKESGAELPFLLPSSVKLKNGAMSRADDPGVLYSPDTLHHVKLALEKAALGEAHAPVLRQYHTALGESDPERTLEFVETVAIFLISSLLGEIVGSILARPEFAGFGDNQQDFISFNMAIPVADADNKRVAAAFDRVLRLGWVIARDYQAFSTLDHGQIQELIRLSADDADSKVTRSQCHVYPEVSANLQVFVKSRSASPGVYLFSDTGAGTVDQCIFEFIRHDPSDGVLYFPGYVLGGMNDEVLQWVNSGEDYLRYFSASVHPLGSSNIEMHAVEVEKLTPTHSHFEYWRKLKESQDNHPALDAARRIVGEQLTPKTRHGFENAKRKVYNDTKLDELRVVFGGGGHCDHPYRRHVLGAFGREPTVVGIPTPEDLDLSGKRGRWFSRLTVAYGLSFQKEDLARFTYPSQLPNVERSRARRGGRRILSIPPCSLI